MPDNKSLELLFIVNPSSGAKNKTDWKEKINNYFKNEPANFKIYELTGGENDKAELKKQLSDKPKKVIAVGGDGTVKMVAEELMHTEMILGILPAGSANGMAKALLINYFDKQNKRGMWGYTKVAFRVFMKKRKIHLDIKLNGENIARTAYMVVLANAKTYGTGAEINPEGSLTDGKFEVVIVKKVTLLQLFRMLVSHAQFDHDCIEIIQTEKAVINSRKKNHFQVDGEYCGKTNTITTEIIPAALKVLIPLGQNKQNNGK